MRRAKDLLISVFIIAAMVIIGNNLVPAIRSLGVRNLQ